MRHQLPLSSLQLPPIEVKPLLQLIQAHRTPQAMVRRARIVLAAHTHPDWSSQQLAQLLELKARLVRKWRRRGPETHSLQDAPRLGPPRRFSSQDRAQVTALARPLTSISWSPLGSLEPCGPGTLCGGYSWPAFSLGQHHWELSCSRADSRLSLPFAGLISRTLKRISRVLAPCCSCMNRPLSCGAARHLGRLCR